MNMNKLALACGVALLGLSSVVAAEVSTNIGVTSNYIWRGMTQNGNDTALSGGIDYSHDSGIYAGTWISEAWTDYELDLYGGYGGEVAGISYDAGLIYYTYTTDADSNFAEINANVGWDFLSAGFAYVITAEDAVEAVEEDMYFYVGASYDLPEDFSIGLTVGFINTDGDGDADGEDYTHYQFDVTKSTGDFGDVTFSLSDTDLDRNEVAAAGTDDADMRFLVSWSKEF